MTRTALTRCLLGTLLAVALLVGTGATAAQAKPAHTKAAKKKKKPKPPKLAPFHTGVSYIYREDGEPVAFQRVREAGASIVLMPLEWGRLVPEQRPANWDPSSPFDPNYEWGLYDKWVVNAVASGLTPVIQIRGAPKWAQRCGPFEIDAPCDINPADLAAFATAAARRYSGQVPGLPHVIYWQGLNEPNLSLFFNPQYIGGQAVSASLYRVLLNTFYGAVKAVDPSNLVISAGLGPIAVKNFTIGPMQFTRELLCMKGRYKFKPLPGNCEGGVNFDIFDMHPYTTGAPTHKSAKDDVQISGLQKLHELIEAADKANRINSVYKKTPLWVTEFSWDSNPPDPGGLDDTTEMRWTSEALYQAWKAGVSDFFWFSLRDVEKKPSVPFDQSLESGLFYRGSTLAADQPKPVFFAFRFPFVAFPEPGGLHFWGRTPTSTPGKVRIQVLKGGTWKTVMRVKANKAGMFEGDAPTGYGRNKNGWARANYGTGGTSVPFAMKPIPDHYQPPFG
jgi:hypothetical protein